MSEEFLNRLDEQAREWAQGRERVRRIGLLMVIFLIAGTVIEYIVSKVLSTNVPILVALNIAEAAGILWFFMHVRRAWRSEEH